MHLVDLTLTTPEENLALDEALLDRAETASEPVEYLRLWEAPAPLVVVGRSSRTADEVDLAACERLYVPILRRSSGGAAIVAGPGCLMYALVLSTTLRPELSTLAGAHATVLDTLVAGLVNLAPGVHRAGTSDLAIHDRKFSGNSLRVKRSHVLYHGTLLYDFPLERIAACLRTPPRQPEYRAAREHGAFVTNLPLTVEQLRQALIRAWSADVEALDSIALGERVTQLVVEKYSRREWNYSL